MEGEEGRRWGGGSLVPRLLCIKHEKGVQWEGVMYIVLMASFHEGKKTYSEKALKKYDNVHMTLPPDSNLV